MSFAWPLTGTPNPLVDKRYPALTLRAFTTEQTLIKHLVNLYPIIEQSHRHEQNTEFQTKELPFCQHILVSGHHSVFVQETVSLLRNNQQAHSVEDLDTQ